MSKPFLVRLPFLASGKVFRAAAPSRQLHPGILSKALPKYAGSPRRTAPPRFRASSPRHPRALRDPNHPSPRGNPPIQLAAIPRSRLWDYHKQACGNTTYWFEGFPHTCIDYHRAQQRAEGREAGCSFFPICSLKPPLPPPPQPHPARPPSASICVPKPEQLPALRPPPAATFKPANPCPERRRRISTLPPISQIPALFPKRYRKYPLLTISIPCGMIGLT
jgi:hypothetical protein